MLIRRLAFGPVLVALLAGSAPAQTRSLTQWESTARDLLRELIEINTTHGTGNTVTAARAMETRLLAAGFPAGDVVVVENAERKGNLIARLRGRDAGRKGILLLSHIDVVEANPEDWTLPPFSFIERDGNFYGRGVADDKDEGAIHLALIMRMRAEGYVPDRDIIVALTADEEGGPANGVAWLIENRPELIDAEFALNEGGGGRTLGGVRLSNDVQASEKKVQNFILEATNPGGHSSRPVRDNAITHLSAALVKLGAFDFPIRLNEITRAYFSRSARTAGGQIGAAMAALVANPNDVGAARTLSADPGYNAQLRTTCVATTLTGGHATNALPQRARANVNCRILPDESADDIQATIERVIADPAVKVLPQGRARNSPPSPLTPELMRRIEQVTAEVWPGVPVIPTMSTGATDGSYLRTAGTPVYGVSGLFYGDTGAHGMNERISSEAFYQGLDFMYRLVRNLTSGPVP